MCVQLFKHFWLNLDCWQAVLQWTTIHLSAVRKGDPSKSLKSSTYIYFTIYFNVDSWFLYQACAFLAHIVLSLVAVNFHVNVRSKCCLEGFPNYLLINKQLLFKYFFSIHLSSFCELISPIKNISWLFSIWLCDPHLLIHTSWRSPPSCGTSCILHLLPSCVLLFFVCLLLTALVALS